MFIVDKRATANIREKNSTNFPKHPKYCQRFHIYTRKFDKFKNICVYNTVIYTNKTQFFSENFLKIII